MQLLLSSNAFLSAYYQSDLFGKFIFISLFFLSIMTWSLFFKKLNYLKQIKKNSYLFRNQLIPNRNTPLHIATPQKVQANPFLSIYTTLKRSALEILSKNRSAVEEGALLSTSDIELVESQVDLAISREAKGLEKNLYLLSMTVSLAPFLGLLGTVWGILTTFSELQNHARGSSETVLAGLSMALATTILGLLVAIPALIGFSYLRSRVREFSAEMVDFSGDLLNSVEMQYRKVDLHG